MIILDTCVISEALKPSPSAAVLNWIDTLPEERVYIPSLVLGELRKGIDLLPSGSKKQSFTLWLEQLQERFKGRILILDGETALVWATLSARLQKEGKPAPVVDSLIAAHALKHHALLATRNIQDYENSGIDLSNPWQD